MKLPALNETPVASAIWKRAKGGVSKLYNRIVGTSPFKELEGFVGEANRSKSLFHIDADQVDQLHGEKSAKWGKNYVSKDGRIRACSVKTLVERTDTDQNRIRVSTSRNYVKSSEDGERWSLVETKRKIPMDDRPRDRMLN